MTKIDLGVKYKLEKYCSLEDGIDEVCPELKKDGIIRAYYDKVRWNKHQLQKRVDELVDWDGEEEV